MGKPCKWEKFWDTLLVFLTTPHLATILDSFISKWMIQLKNASRALHILFYQQILAPSYFSNHFPWLHIKSFHHQEWLFIQSFKLRNLMYYQPFPILTLLYILNLELLPIETLLLMFAFLQAHPATHTVTYFPGDFLNCSFTYLS